jgi:hypothetical protein
MRLWLIILAGLLCFAMSSCPKPEDEYADEQTTIDDEGMRQPDFGGEETAAPAGDEAAAEGAEGAEATENGDESMGGDEGDEGDEGMEAGGDEETGDEGMEEEGGDESSDDGEDEAGEAEDTPEEGA